MVIAEVTIRLKEGVADPEGTNTKKALGLLGWEVEDVRSGKVFEIDLGEELTRKEAREEVEEMCKRLLANPVIQTYEIDIEDRR